MFLSYLTNEPNWVNGARERASFLGLSSHRFVPYITAVRDLEGMREGRFQWRISEWAPSHPSVTEGTDSLLEEELSEL
jgi:hypothetical protein